MRIALLGLTMPILLLSAAFAGFAPHAAAQDASVHTVSGRVVSDAGDPIEGARVSGYTYVEDRKMESAYQNAEAVTDADGRFALKLAAGKGYVNVWYEKWRIGDGRDLVVEADVTDLTFTLRTPPPRTATISGVVLGPSGEPIEGAQVTLGYGCCYAMPAEVETSDGGGASGVAAPSRVAFMPPVYDDSQTTTTDALGRFAFQVYAGPRQVTAWAKGYAQESAEVEARENEITEVTLRLDKIPARDAVLVGRILDADTGLPVAGAVVSARSLEWGRYAEARTGADGRYRFVTMPGWTEVSVNVWPDYGEPKPLAEADALVVRALPTDPQYFASTTLTKLGSGENVLDVELDAKPRPTIVLLGYVVDSDAKKGVAGARVNVWNQETGDWGEAITDATGSFRVLVRPGHYSGSAWKEGYLGGTQTFLVTEAATQRVDLLLPRGETRYVPCYDEEECGPVVMDESKAVAVGAPEPAPAVAEGPRTATAAQDADASNAGAPGPDTSRTASFSGSGGGLPPYDPAQTGAIPAAERSTPTEVPGVGALALMAIVGLAALALRRR